MAARRQIWKQFVGIALQGVTCVCSWNMLLCCAGGNTFVQAFTEHYPIVHYAKWVLKMPVVTDMSVEAEHAYLPKYVLDHGTLQC